MRFLELIGELSILFFLLCIALSFLPDPRDPYRHQRARWRREHERMKKELMNDHDAICRSIEEDIEDYFEQPNVYGILNFRPIFKEVLKLSSSIVCLDRGKTPPYFARPNADKYPEVDHNYVRFNTINWDASELAARIEANKPLIDAIKAARGPNYRQLGEDEIATIKALYVN